MLDSFFESISWPMEPPPAYGAFHILFTLIGFAVCSFSAWKLRNVSNRVAGRILFFCGLFLTISEVFKQFFYYSFVLPFAEVIIHTLPRCKIFGKHTSLTTCFKSVEFHFMVKRNSFSGVNVARLFHSCQYAKKFRTRKQIHY